MRCPDIHIPSFAETLVELLFCMDDFQANILIVRSSGINTLLKTLLTSGSCPLYMHGGSYIQACYYWTKQNLVFVNAAIKD